jgi:arginine repressor
MGLNQTVMSRRRIVPFALFLAVAFVALFARPYVGSAQGVDVIRGEVVGPDNAPLADARITATSVSGGVNRTARTNSEGRFTITFPGGEGDYFMTFAAIGYAPRQFELKRLADEDFLVADATLSRSVATLDTLRVSERGRVAVDANKQPDLSGTEQAADAAAVSADQQGDLNAIASSIPGITEVLGADGDPAGFSVLGLSADQNSTTLNGSSFGGSNLPRDADVSYSVVTAPFDVSRGGFSGGQLNIRSSSGSNYIRRSASLNLDAPALQWTDPAARALGQQYTNVSLGGSLAGPIIFDKAFYNISYQLGRRSNDLRTILNTSPVGLQASGIAADSAARLAGLLNSDGIPTLVDGRIPSSRLNDNGLIFGSLNLTPPNSTSGQTFNLTFDGTWNRQSPASSLATEVPAHGGDRTRLSGSLQFGHTAYVRSKILSETTIALDGGRTYGTPYLDLPSASVLVNSDFDDGTTGVRTIGFGGSPSLSTKSSNLTLDANNVLSWFSKNNKHRLKFSTELTRDGYNQDRTTNLLGTFNFNSIGDFQANQPTSFSRSLSPRVQSASATKFALSLGDSYRRTSALQIQYGLRVEGNRFSTGPEFNPEIQQTFGIRNDERPNHVYASPRVGFSWTYGDAPQISAFQGAVRTPRAVVRGGLGVFQDAPNSSLIGTAIDNTGLPSAVQQLSCVGAATPFPDWADYLDDPSTIPIECADGTNGGVFANAAPNVTLFAKDYSTPRSVRGNLQWSGPILANRFSLTANATYSRNLNQSSFIDLNFSPVAQFGLADEGGRPVFVQPGSIVPTSGAIASGDARVSPLFNRVSEEVSDLVSESRQLRLSFSPATFTQNFSWSLSYVYSNNRAQYRGFSSTVGNPLDVDWGRSSSDSRHQITYNLRYNFLDAVRINWSGRFSSGRPYTPLVSGDVNGDGYSNDRAFIFDPTTSTDPAIAGAMQSLLSGPAHDCLAQQLGKLAAYNSCEGPWSSSARLSFSFNSLKLRLPQRATLTFDINNPLGAADILMHGENNLHGWGQNSSPDQALFYVRGFDPTTRSYKYDVNPRFGSTNPQFQQFRSPVTLTMALKIDVGPSRERQRLTQELDRGRLHEGFKLPASILKAQYGSGGVLNPMAQMLRQSDTLDLTGSQADSLATMNRRYTIELDSIWTPVVQYWAALPKDYDQGAAYRRYKHAREASVDLLIALAPRINALITDEQKRRLPSLVASHLDTRYLEGIRSGTVGGSAGGAFFAFSGGGGGLTSSRF